jgi:hypothetical protein
VAEAMDVAQLSLAVKYLLRPFSTNAQ